MQRYFSFDQENYEFEFHDTLEDAKANAEHYLEYYRDEASSDGWPEDLIGSVGYGDVLALSTQHIVAEKENYTEEEWDEMGYGDEWDAIVDYSLTNVEDIQNKKNKKENA